MTGETNLAKLIRGMAPLLHDGTYVFASVQNLDGISRRDAICEFREEEGVTLVLERKKADELQLSYEFIAAWITLTVHSSLEAIGLSAAVSSALAKNQISCNLIAACSHDHVFVPAGDAEKAMHVLHNLSLNPSG